jgi:hypothetical protein
MRKLNISTDHLEMLRESLRTAVEDSPNPGPRWSAFFTSVIAEIDRSLSPDSSLSASVPPSGGEGEGAS